jgi:hypothetical protein
MLHDGGGGMMHRNDYFAYSADSAGDAHKSGVRGSVFAPSEPAAASNPGFLSIAPISSLIADSPDSEPERAVADGGPDGSRPAQADSAGPQIEFDRSAISSVLPPAQGDASTIGKADPATENDLAATHDGDQSNEHNTLIVSESDPSARHELAPRGDADSPERHDLASGAASEAPNVRHPFSA